MTKMTSPDPKDPLLLYVSASPSAVSAALVVERLIEGHPKQLPVYFVSEALSNSKLFYSELEKIAYAMVMALRKLRHYFEGHRTIVVTSQPIHDLFHNREASARISKWAAELSIFWKKTIKVNILFLLVMDQKFHCFALVYYMQNSICTYAVAAVFCACASC